MKNLALVICILSLLNCKNTERNTAKETPIKSTGNDKFITFDIRVVKPYCGGAAPTEEMEQMRMKGEPAKAFVFYLHREGNAAIRLETNQNGQTMVVLKRGEYCLKEGYKSDAEMAKSLEKSDWEFDDDCLTQWKAKCNRKFTVSDSSKKVVQFTYYDRCGWEGPVPCVTNAGFPPP